MQGREARINGARRAGLSAARMKGARRDCRESPPSPFFRLAGSRAEFPAQLVDADFRAVLHRPPECPAVAGGQALRQRADLVDRADDGAERDGAVGADDGGRSGAFRRTARRRARSCPPRSGWRRRRAFPAVLASGVAKALSRQRLDGGDARASRRRDSRIALDADEMAAEPFRHRAGGAGAEKRIEHDIAGLRRPPAGSGRAGLRAFGSDGSCGPPRP